MSNTDFVSLGLCSYVYELVSAFCVCVCVCVCMCVCFRVFVFLFVSLTICNCVCVCCMFVCDLKCDNVQFYVFL